MNIFFRSNVYILKKVLYLLLMVKNIPFFKHYIGSNSQKKLFFKTKSFQVSFFFVQNFKLSC